jgi:hypothetical protein
VPDQTLSEVRDLLAEIRDLLLPVADAYRDEYDIRIAQREADRLDAIRALLSTERRTKAFALADGTRTQREIAKESGMDEGGASKFFKGLRDLRAVSDSPKPRRIVEVM